MRTTIKGDTKKIDRDEFLFEMAVLRDSFEIYHCFECGIWFKEK